MGQNKDSELDHLLLERLTPIQKLRALFDAKVGSVGRWAVRLGYMPEQVYMCLSGAREYPDIRDEIAKEIGLSREAVEEALGSSAPQAA